MDAVRQINNETLLAFVTRAGPVTVDCVRSRFGWGPLVTHQELDRLVTHGYLKRRVVTFSQYGYGGRRFEWERIDHDAA